MGIWTDFDCFYSVSYRGFEILASHILKMASSPCFFSSQICVSIFKVDRLKMHSSPKRIGWSRTFAPKEILSELFSEEVKQCIGWTFLGGSRTIGRSNHGKVTDPGRKSIAVNAAWLPSSEVADMAFTMGTVAVLPFYTCMVVAPRAEITKKLVASSIPYMVLGTLYAYLLYQSWTPDTLRLLFASKYWLPELPGILKMFSSEMVLVSAWIHLLTVDLFAARQVYHDGLLNDVETRHSITLCLFFCPIGMLVHLITKTLSRSKQNRNTVTK